MAEEWGLKFMYTTCSVCTIGEKGENQIFRTLVSHSKVFFLLVCMLCY